MQLSLKKADIGGISENPDSWSLGLPKARQDDSNAHSRVFSTSLLVEETNATNSGWKRTISAMGYLSPRGTDWEPEDDESPWTPLSRNTDNTGRQCDLLGSLGEAQPGSVDDSSSSARRRNRYSRDSPKDEDGHSSSHSLYLDRQAPREVKRASSTTQIRDLREQMHDLRGRISSLRQRTREDSLQRQSMQKLKSPSPFSVAPGWEDEDTKVAELSPPIASNSSTAHLVGPGSELPLEISAFEPDTPDESNTDPFDNVSSIPASPTFAPESDPYTLDHGVVSPTTPPRSSSPPSPGPRTPAHEDRPDAFNYEQYFLTSTLPRYTRPVDPNPPAPENTPLKIQDPHSLNLRRNTQSSSSSSASTTKALSSNPVHESSSSSPGTEEMFPPKAISSSQPSSPVKSIPTAHILASDTPTASKQYSHAPYTNQFQNPNSSAPARTPSLPTSTKASHIRQSSGDSISTVNTFATCAENAQSPSDNDGGTDEADNTAAISDLGIGFSHPGWRDEQSTRTRSGTVTQSSTPANGYHSPARNAARSRLSRLAIDPGTREKRLSSESKTPTTRDPASLSSPISSTDSQHLSPINFPLISHLDETDKKLVHDLLDALSRVCLDAQDLGEENVYERKVLRRRLDGARRVLEGRSEGVLRG